ncbi:MAG: alpha/beta fold hydrolase [Deltaproteobacteria bacterium]|nr:alpha/beta fold hydrolase [Deltaproteobacteria bacterium]
MRSQSLRNSVLLAAAVAAACACSRRGAPPDPEAALPRGGAEVSAAPAPLPEPAPRGLADAGPAVERPIEPPAPLPGAEAGVPEAVELETSDGVTLHADLWRTGDPEAPAVVLVHQARSDRSEWAPFVAALRARAPGLTVLALDLRGHGASTRAGDATIRWQDLSSGDRSGLRRWAGCTVDVQAAIAWLRGREEGSIPRAIGLVGSSIGSSSALRAAANDGVAGPGRIAAVVVLSPGLSYFSVPIQGAVETLKMRKLPVLLVGARDDSADVGGTAPQMAEILGDVLDLHLFDDGGHGVAILDAHPEVVPILIDFLKSRLGL